MQTFDKIVKLVNQLFPTGRAFRGPVDGDLYKLRRAISRSKGRLFDDARSVLDSQLPDNDNFTVQDAADNERRYGLITNPDVSLADRKLAIIRKINHPGTIEARQNYRYVEGQLQDAGFNVYVYENRFPYGDGTYYTKIPEVFSLLPYPKSDFEYGDAEYGDSEYGGGRYGNKVVNYIEEELDDDFEVGSNFRSTFYIGASTPGAWATVDDERKSEFRELILKLKPRQMVAFLLVNFT